jgi:uncharacterized protein (DUF2147 family)
MQAIRKATYRYFFRKHGFKPTDMIKNIKSLVACLLLAGSATAQNADAIVGTWLVQDGSAKIAILEDGGHYHGRIVWLREPNDSQGRPVRDTNNPDARLRSRPQMGLMLLTDFAYDGGNLWNDGEIYDPDSGSTYSCKITLKDRQTMQVRGYIGFSLFGRTETWTRVPDIAMGSAY